MRRYVVSLLLLCAFNLHVQAAPNDFSQSKRLLRQHVYFDQNQTQRGDFYCGCSWRWAGRSGGQMDLDSCGYAGRKMADRAQRLEWEHVMPISNAGQHRQCWRNGGRENCQRTDPVFNRMEADMHNLVPSIGSVNGLRSNWSFGVVSGPSEPIGACPTKVGIVQRTVEPRAEAKGQAARITFYMADRYNVRLSDKQQRVLMAWDREFPVTEWELERDRRIAYSMGHNNPFVTGERQWVPGYRPKGEGLSGPATRPVAQQPKPVTRLAADARTEAGPVRGNRRSRVYHLPQGCPCYNQVSDKNRQEFASESEAITAGFRKAGNCA